MSASNLDVFIGIPKEEIDTPALLIDVDIMEANIQKMAGFFKTVNADLRPHVKTHKTPIIAHKQMEAGAIGMTCAKLGEAEAMIHAGIRDVLIANQIVGKQKIARLINLAKHSEIMVAVDDADNVDQLSAAAEGKRHHVARPYRSQLWHESLWNGTGTTNAGSGASYICNRRHSSLKGSWVMRGIPSSRRLSMNAKSLTGESVDMLIGTKHFLEQNGVPVKIVSGGGTGTYAITGAYPDMTEIQAGSYVFIDSSYRGVEGIGEAFGCALTMLTTVVSRPHPTRVIVDAGAKVLTSDSGTPQPVRN